MAVAFRASATASGATSVTKPTGTVSGDVVVLVSNFYDSAAATMTWPSGFTQIALQRETGAAGHEIALACAWKVAGGSEPASYTITNSAGAFQDLMALTYSGADGTTPIDTSSAASHAANIGAGYTATWTGVTAARNSSIALALFGGYDKDCTTPSGYTARVNALDSAVDASELAVNAGSVSGPTGTVASDAGGGNNGSALILVIIQPAGASAPSSAPTLTAGAGGGALFAGGTSCAPTVSSAPTGAALFAGAPSSAPSLNASASTTGSNASAAPLDSFAATGRALFAGVPSSAPSSTAGATGAALFAGAPSSSPSISAAAAASSPANIYFRDDFSGSVVDTSVWAVWNRVGDLLNSELECYVTGQATVTGGSLVLTCEVHTQSCGDSETAPASHSYRSGGVAQLSKPFRYGTITFRAQMPASIGAWPAIWLLGYKYHDSHTGSPGTNNPTGQDWPNDGWGEIDILEVFNPTTSGTVKQIIHQDANNTGGDVALGFDPTAAMHTYQLIWSPGSLVWKVDGTTTKTITGAQVSANPMFLIMNVAVGGNGGGTPTDATFPTSMLVDFVEVQSDTTSPSSAPSLTAGATGVALFAGAPSCAPTLSASAQTACVAASSPGISAGATGASKAAGDGSSAPTVNAAATAAGASTAASAPTLNVTAGGATLVAAAGSSAPTLGADAGGARLGAGAPGSAPTFSAAPVGAVLYVAAGGSSPGISAGATGAVGPVASSAPSISAAATGASRAAAAASCSPFFLADAGGQINGIASGGGKWRPDYYQKGWVPDYFGGL
jgi:beta-glucanase (GH16 family)